MCRANLDDLRERVDTILKGTTLRDHVAGIEIRPGSDNDGSEFLRVILRFYRLGSVNRDELRKATDTIEDDLLRLDERFPSVRVSEAA